MSHDDDYPTEPVIVLARLSQRFEALCPVTGEQFSNSREMSGLTKEMLVDYGDDWLDVMAADVPAGWLVRIEQRAILTSAQLPTVIDTLDDDHRGRWKPKAEAMANAKRQVRRFARPKRWGGGR